MTPSAAILDQYPSTSDYQTKDPVDDPVLVILKNARKRYQDGATSCTYIRGSMVCAIGAIAAAVGADEYWENVLYDNYKSGMPAPKHMFKYYLYHELKISDATKEAINLLDKSAIFLYGNRIPKKSDFAWTLEWINQRFDWDSGEAKEAVLSCYDHAILERERAALVNE